MRLVRLCCQFLPEMNEAPPPKVARANRGVDLPPRLKQIRPPQIDQHDEAALELLRGKHVTDQLETLKRFFITGKKRNFEYGIEIVVAQDVSLWLRGKVGFSQFGFDNGVTEHHVEFSLTLRPILEPQLTSHTKLGFRVCGSGTNNRGEASGSSGKTETVHQESIGAIARVQFLGITPALFRKGGGLRMSFVEALSP